jgi:hypothetical protein
VEKLDRTKRLEKPKLDGFSRSGMRYGLDWTDLAQDRVR